MINAGLPESWALLNGKLIDYTISYHDGFPNNDAVISNQCMCAWWYKEKFRLSQTDCKSEWNVGCQHIMWKNVCLN
jgi:hypothetical protein